MPKIIVKEPGKEMRVVDFDGKYRCDVKPFLGEDITLEYVQMQGGEDSRLAMVCDEDGKIKQLPYNFCLPLQFWGVDAIVGTICFVRYRWENPWEKELWDFELMDLTDEDISAIRRVLGEPYQKALRSKL